LKKPKPAAIMDRGRNPPRPPAMQKHLEAPTLPDPKLTREVLKHMLESMT
jgi:hypothetical protein